MILANHWARVVEMLQAAERCVELVNDREITSKDLRNIPTKTPTVGIGIVEAPRGTLIHHYETDDRGLITKVNLIVATAHNGARIAMGVEKVAKGLIHGGKINDGLLNMVEMAFRAYDPCNACATHSLPGEMPLHIWIHDEHGNLIQELKRSFL
jgi:F420-non-reducing hydrogenase large subunit